MTYLDVVFRYGAYDASRLKAEAVAGLLRQAGVDVRERLELA